MLKTVSSFVNSIGALNYKGTWNANSNSPTLASGVGAKGDYYVVSVAGSTNLDGATIWGVGDWAVFNGTVWQRVDGGDTGNFTTLFVGDNTTPTNLTVLSALFSTNTGTGQNIVVRKSNDTTSAAIIVNAKSRGTAAAPTVVQVNDAIGSYRSDAFAGTNYRPITSINGIVETYTSDTNIGGALTFNTNTGGVSVSEKMRIDAAGNVGIGISTPSSYAKLTVWGGNAWVQSTTVGTGSKITLSDTNNAVSIESLPVSGATDVVFKTNTTTRMTITSSGNVVAGGSVALATNATDGFVYVPTCAGVPTGTPTAITGMAPIVIDTTNNRLYFYSGGAWQNAGP